MLLAFRTAVVIQYPMNSYLKGIYAFYLCISDNTKKQLSPKEAALDGVQEAHTNQGTAKAVL